MVDVNRVGQHRHHAFDNVLHALLGDDVAQRRKGLGHCETHDREATATSEGEGRDNFRQSRPEGGAQVESGDRENGEAVEESLRRCFIVELGICQIHVTCTIHCVNDESGSRGREGSSHTRSENLQDDVDHAAPKFGHPVKQARAES